MTKGIVEYEEPIAGVLQQFQMCDEPVVCDGLVDMYGRAILSAFCTFPLGHDGPCALVHYKSIQYTRRMK